LEDIINFDKEPQDSYENVLHARNQNKQNFAPFAKKSLEFTGSVDRIFSIDELEREKIGKLYTFENVIKSLDTELKGEKLH
jgi:hypothetical protein